MLLELALAKATMAKHELWIEVVIALAWDENELMQILYGWI